MNFMHTNYIFKTLLNSLRCSQYITWAGIWWSDPGPEPYSTSWCIIISSRILQTTGSAQIYWSKQAIVCQQVNTAPNPLAKEELNLLAKLMGGLEVPKSGNADNGFRVNLFNTDEEEEWVSFFVCLLAMCCMALDQMKHLLKLNYLTCFNRSKLTLWLLLQRGINIKTRWPFIWSYKHPSNKGKASPVFV